MIRRLGFLLFITNGKRWNVGNEGVKKIGWFFSSKCRGKCYDQTPLTVRGKFQGGFAIIMEYEEWSRDK